MHQIVPTYLLPIFGIDSFPTNNIPKSGLNRIPNLGHFPPSPNHTLYTSLVMGLTHLHGWDVEGQSPNLTLLICLATFIFSLILFSFSFSHFLPLAMSYFFMHFLLPWLCLISSSHVSCHYDFVSFFFMHFLLCLSFSLVWLFFPSRRSCCWYFLLFLVSSY